VIPPHELEIEFNKNETPDFKVKTPKNLFKFDEHDVYENLQK
jgi:hypothetical protein